MEPNEDRIAKRRAEIKREESALDGEAADLDPDAMVVDHPKGRAVRSAVFLVGVLVVAAGLFGTAVTLGRLSGDDFADAERLGLATVSSCVRHGPVSNKGFGYWESCSATITWDDGDVDRLTVDAVFKSSDIGAEVRVGDLGNYRTSRELARSDVAHRPWLGWIGYAIGILALVPALVGTLALRELLRRR